MTFYTFANATSAIPLSNLDSNFATPITLGNTAVTINGTFSSIGNLTLNNTTIASGNITVTNETVTTITSPAATNLTIQSAGTTAMTIDTSQNVGIGVAPYATGMVLYRNTAGLLYNDVQNPSTTNSTDGSIFRLITSNTAGSGTISFDVVKYKNGTAAINNNETNSAANIAFGVGGSERMRIDSSGNVGIGTTSPSTYGKLVSVTGDNATTFAAVGATNMMRVQGYNSTYAGTLMEAVNLAQSANTPLFINASQTLFGISGTEKMRIDSSGNLLVGTTSAGAGAIVDVQSTTKGVRFPNMTTTQKTAITPAAGTVVFDTTLAKLCVYTGAAWQTITSV